MSKTTEERKQFFASGIWLDVDEDVGVEDFALCGMILALRDSGEFSKLEALVIVTLTITHGADPVTFEQAKGLINQAMRFEADGTLDSSTIPTLPQELILAAKTLIAEVEKSVDEIIGEAMAALSAETEALPFSEEQLDQMSSMAALAAAQVPVNLRN